MQELKESVKKVFLNNIKKTHNRTLKILEDKVSDVYIFGVGKYGQLLLQILRERGLEPKGFIDNYLQEEHFLGLKVFRANQVENKEALIILSSLFYMADFWNHFTAAGFKNLLPFTVILALEDRFLDDKTVFGDTLEDYLLDVFLNKEEYLKTMDLFEDDESKEALKTIISLRENLDYSPCVCDDVNTSEIYFDKGIFEISEQEVFVDGGGFIGDTSLDFIRLVDGKYKKIYLFEPCEENMAKAVENLSPYQNIEFVPKGISDKETFSGFSSTECNTVGAHFSADSDTGIELVSLDLAVQEPVSFIKFDIEGCEKDGLLGAQNVLKKDRPMLAIAAYHKPCDVWELAQLIKKINPDYKLYFRVYIYNRELILYAK